MLTLLSSELLLPHCLLSPTFFRINVKLGGINTIPDSPSINTLLDQRKLTIVMGADVIHPAPGAEGRPSYAAVVGSIDPHLAKYTAVSQVQTSRQEIISGLDEMTKVGLGSKNDALESSLTLV